MFKTSVPRSRKGMQKFHEHDSLYLLFAVLLKCKYKGKQKLAGLRAAVTNSFTKKLGNRSFQ